MGRRLRAVLVLLALLATAALAAPLALSSADRRTSDLALERGRQLDGLAQQVALTGVDPEPLARRYAEVYGEGVGVVAADGRVLAAADLDPRAPEVTATWTAALVDEPPVELGRVLPWTREPVLVGTGVRRNGEVVAAVVIRVDRHAAAADVARSWAWLVVACMAMLALAVFIAGRLTAWLLRPLAGLERAVGEMTAGLAGTPAPVTGPPELRHLATGFNTMADAVRESLERQRRLVADASHQLRNPLAAVRLRADLLGARIDPDSQQTFDALGAELDRLERLLQQLLRLARAEEASSQRQAGLDAGGQSADLADVVAQRVSVWAPVAEAAGHEVVDRVEPGGRVGVAADDLAQLLDVALDNALKHGGRSISVSALDRGSTVELRISDDGPGLLETERARAVDRFWRGDTTQAGSGLGLAIAREIALGHGGVMDLDRASEGGLLVRFTLPGAAS